MKVPARFPQSIWDGTSRSREAPALLSNETPSAEDYDQVLAEIIALESFVINLTGGAGNVSSVDLAMPSGFIVTNNPVTGVGILTVGMNITGIVKGTGNGIAQAVLGTDYYGPGSLIPVASLPVATASTLGIAKFNGGLSVSAGLVTASSLISKSFVLGKNSSVTVGTDKLDKFTVPGGLTATLQRIRINAKVAPVGADLILDIKVNGVSIGGNLRLLNGTMTNTINVFTNTSFTSGAVITVDVTQVGLSVAGQDVTVELEFLTSLA